MTISANSIEIQISRSWRIKICIAFTELKQTRKFNYVNEPQSTPKLAPTKLRLQFKNTQKSRPLYECLKNWNISSLFYNFLVHFVGFFGLCWSGFLLLSSADTADADADAAAAAVTFQTFLSAIETFKTDSKVGEREKDSSSTNF